MGRPTTYTPEIATKICAQLAAGDSLRSICAPDDMPPEATVRLWVVDDREGFAAQYVRARDIGLDCVADAMIAISDEQAEVINEKGTAFDPDVNRDRLRVDTRKWYLSKIAPKRYGERLAHEISGPDGGPIQIDDETRAAKIDAIFAAAARNRDTGTDLV